MSFESHPPARMPIERPWRKCCLALIIVLSVGIVSADRPDGGLSLTDGTFDDALRKHERVFIQWYAPWCDKCVKLWPELSKVSKRLTSDGLKTQVAYVDATSEVALAGKYDIRGPELHYWVEGKKLDVYERGQTADEMWQWLRKRERPDVRQLDADRIEKFAREGEDGQLALVAHVKRKSVRHEVFLQSLGAITDVLRDTIQFGIVWLPTGADPKRDSKLEMWRVGVGAPDAEHVEFDGSWTKIDIASWVKKSSFPTLGVAFTSKYDPDIVQDLGWDGIVVACGGDTNEEDDDNSDWIGALGDMMRPIASSHPSWKFTLCDSDSLTNKEKELLLGDTEIKQDTKMFVSFRLGAKRRYVLDDPDSLKDTERITRFLVRAKGGKIPGRYKTEPRPSTGIDQDVVVLTGRDFEERIKDAKKDYFVEFTHPRCEHCKQLTPVWNKLAKEVRARGWHKKGVVIAKIDMESNDCEENVQEFPKLVLYPAVKRDRKMKQRQIYTPDKVKSLADFPIQKFLDFLSNNAINLDGEEERAIEAEFAKTKPKNKKTKREL